LKPLLPTLIAGALTLAATAAFAADPSPASQTRINGVVSSIAGGEATVDTADHKAVKVHLTADTHVMTSEHVSASTIAPGVYLGTTNMDQADGSGVSSEVHIIKGLGAAGKGVNVPWDGGAMMTNGNVSKVSQGPAGPQIEINYGPGTKKVVVPRNSSVVLLSPTEPSRVKKGSKVLVAGAAQADGAILASYITVDVPSAK
jgi:hypothetical protein